MRKVPISSIADVTAGQSAPKPDEFSDSGIPFVRAGSLEDLIAGKCESNLELVPAQTAKKRNLKLYPKGSILFAKSGMSATKDRIYVLQNPAYVVSHLAILTSKDNVHRDYLRLALKQFPPSSLIKDPAYPAIGLGEIQGYEIPVPEEIDDQKRIAHLLGKVEGLIARRKHHLHQLDDLLKSVFLEMFGDLVRNEKGWERTTIGELASEVKYGTSASAQGGPYTYLRMNNITQEGYWDFESLKYIDVPEKDFEKYSLRKGDLVFNRTNSKELVGKTAVYDRDEPVIIAGYLIRVRFDQHTNPWFVWGHLNSKYGKTRLFNLCRNIVGMANINAKELQAIPILNPPNNLQNQFAAIVEKIEALKSRYEHSLSDLESLYGGLSQKAFKGELDLSRVVLPKEAPGIEEEEKIDVEEIQPMEPLFELPAPKKHAALHTAEGRNSLLGEWLNVWLTQLGDAPFAAQNFMDAARQRLWELAEDEASDWGAAEYDELKDWVFEALEQGRLTQSYDDANNRVQIAAAKR